MQSSRFSVLLTLLLIHVHLFSTKTVRNQSMERWITFIIIYDVFICVVDINKRLQVMGRVCVAGRRL